MTHCRPDIWIFFVVGLIQTSLSIVDLTDIAKPYAKKMDNVAVVRDGDKGQLS